MEDLGRAARVVTISAYVSGSDYISRMRKLIAACEKEGEGRYVDPWLGAMKVRVTQMSSPEFSTANYASITITFTEAGELLFPTGLTDTGALCSLLSNDLTQKALGAFVGETKALTLLDSAKENLSKSLGDILTGRQMQVLGSMLGISENLSDLAGDALTLIEGGMDVFGQRVVDTLGLSEVSSNICRWRNAAWRISKLIGTDDLKVNALSSNVRVSGSGVLASQEKAGRAVANLVQETMAANLIMAAPLVGSDQDRAGKESAFETMAYDDLIEVRDAMLEAMDEVMFETESDEVCAVLAKGRNAVYENMTERAENMARIVEYEPASVVPGIVLAYDRYEDANREEEIIGRNAVRHPGFVPAVKLKLLTA